MKGDVVREHPAFESILVMHVAVVDTQNVLESAYHRFNIATALVVRVRILQLLSGVSDDSHLNSQIWHQNSQKQKIISNFAKDFQ